MPSIGGFVRDSSGTPADREIRVYRRDTGALLGKTRSSGGDGDPHFGKVSLLLHMDGADGSTTFADSSTVPKTLAVHGNAKISTAHGRFGGSSGHFPGASTDYAVVPASTDFAFGTGDFTIEAWIYITPGIAGSYAAICDIRSSASGTGSTLFKLNSARQLGYYFVGEVNTTEAVPIAQWTHVSLCRASGVSRIFINGIASASTTDTDNKVPNHCYIGRVYDNAHPAFSGYIDDLRITKGIARYTANFTPPAARLPDISGAEWTLAFGEYYFPTEHTGEVNVVCLDDASAPQENDLILRTFLGDSPQT